MALEYRVPQSQITQSTSEKIVNNAVIQQPTSHKHGHFGMKKFGKMASNFISPASMIVIYVRVSMRLEVKLYELGVG